MDKGTPRTRAEKKGVKNVPISDSKASIVWSSHDSTYGGLGAKSEAPDKEIVDAINEAANHLNSNHQMHDHEIWRKAQASTYSKNFPQQTLTNLVQARKNPNFISMDIESVGTMNPQPGDTMKFYAPTEIAMGHMQVSGKYGARIVPGRALNRKYGRYNALSMVLNPGSNYAELDALVKKLEGNRRVNVPLSQDERRTLQDLILYSDPSKFKKAQINGVNVTTLLGQRRDLQPMGAAALIKKSTVANIRAGLENLRNLGTAPENAALAIGHFFDDVHGIAGDVSVVGQNFRAFDRPMILDWLEGQVGKDNPNSKIRHTLDRVKAVNYVDTLGVEKTIRRNPGLLNKNLKLGTLAEQKQLLKHKGAYIGRIKDGAHFGIYDIEMGGRLYASQLLDYHNILEGNKLPLDEVRKDIRYSRFITNPLKIGDRLFATSGVFGGKQKTRFDEQKKYDGVFNHVLNEETKKYEYKPAYIMNNSATLYTNATYRLHDMSRMEREGKTYHTATLFNEDRGTYHFFARENIEELQNIFHKNLAFISGEQNRSDRMSLAVHSRNDAALRRWNKMFSDESGGGVGLINRMSKAYDAWNANKIGTNGQKLKAMIMEAGGHKGKDGWVNGTESFYRDFMTLRGRLRDELPYINEMMSAMNSHPELKGDNHAQNIALRHFRNAMDEKFGSNEHKAEASNAYRSTMGINVDGETRILNISANVDSTANSLHNVITSGHISKNMTPALIRTRIKGVINELRAKTPHLMTRAQRKNIEDMIKQIDGEHSGYYVTQEIALRLAQAQEDVTRRNKVFNMEDPVMMETSTRLVAKRKEALDEHWPTLGTEVINRSMDRGAAYNKRAYGGMVIQPDSILENILQHQDNVVNQIIKKAGIDNSRIIGAKSSKEALNEMLKNYIGTGMRASLYHDQEKRGLVLALYHPDHESSIIGSKMSDLVKNNHVALINLPTINENGELQVGSTRRVARLTALKGPNQSIQIGTGFDELMYKMSSISGVIENMFQNGKSGLEVEGFANTIIRKTTENLSMNNTKNLMADGNAFTVRKSKASNWARRHMIDVSAFAEEWFHDYHFKMGNDPLHHIEKINKLMYDRKNRGMNFFQAMGDYKMYDGNKKRINNKMEFQRDIERWLDEKYKLKVNSHSVKDTLVAQNVRSFANISELTPFGFYNQMARENMMKHVNYLPLEESKVRQGLKDQGFSDADIERMIKRGIMTETAHKELAGETNFLSLRTAYMDSKEVHDSFSKVLDGLSGKELATHQRMVDKLSTYEGMFVMRSDVAAGFTVRRSKEIEISDGSKLTKQIEGALKQGMIDHGLGSEFDYGKTVIFNQAVALNTKDRDRQGRFTVGELAKNKSTDWYTDPQNNVFIKGWDADRQRLILEKEEKLQDGDKMLTSEGHRVTVSIRDQKWFNKAGFGHLEAILPTPEIDKRMYGTFMDSAAQLAYDTMRRHADSISQSKGVTVGKIALENGLATLQDLMSKHLGTEGKMRIVNDQLLLNSMLGTDTPDAYSFKNINRFLSDVGKKFNTDLVGHKHMLGQTGFAIADVTNWEDTMGSVDGEVGKVRWGLKEIDVIQARLNRHATQGIETSAISKWLKGHMTELVHKQAPDAQRMTNALMRTTMNASDRHALRQGDIRPGDVVIRTDATNGEMSVPGLTNEGGKRHGIINKNGVIEVHANAFSDIPMRSARGVNITTGDLQNTIIRMGDNDLSIAGGADGMPKSLSEALKRNHGTALLQLPAGLSHDYVRLIHQDVSSVGGGMAVMKELQQHQSKIWRLVTEYNKANDKSNPAHSLDQLQQALDEYHSKAVYMESAAREQGVSKTLMTAQQDMSGRFKIQGMNPTIAASKRYEEATAYVSREKMSEMIMHKEHQIAQTLFSDKEYKGFMGSVAGKEKEHIRGRLHKKVLDKIQETGLYGFVGRYPTIAEDTIQAMKVAIDPTMEKTYQGAMLTVGTAVKLKADYDGDFLSAVLSHYGLNNAAERDAIHKQLGDVWQEDKKSIRRFYAQDKLKSGEYVDFNPEILHDETAYAAYMKTVHTKSLAHDIYGDMHKLGAEATKRDLTVGQLMRDGYIETLAGDWKKQTGGLHDVESLQARLGKQLIGQVDNTRQKLLNLSGATYDILQHAGKMSAAEAMENRKHIELFGRDLSQNYISSKKFNIKTITDELNQQGKEGTHDEVMAVIKERNEALIHFTEGLMLPNEHGLNLMRSANQKLGIFDDKDQFEEQMQKVQELHKLQGESKDWLYNRNLHYAHSEGLSIDELTNMHRGEGKSFVVNTPQIKELMANMDLSNPDIADAHSRMSRSIRLHERTVLSAFENKDGTNKFLGVDAGTHISEDMLGSTVSEQAGVKLSKTLGDVFGKSGGGGFGALKIGGGVFAAVWAANTLSAKAPSPESMQQVMDGGNPQKAPTPPSVLGGPSARIAMNGESVHMNVSAKGNMDSQRLAAMIHSEMVNQVPMQLNMNMNVNDNSQNIDKQWLNQTMANAISFGRAFN